MEAPGKTGGARVSINPFFFFFCRKLLTLLSLATEPLKEYSGITSLPSACSLDIKITAVVG